MSQHSSASIAKRMTWKAASRVASVAIGRIKCLRASSAQSPSGSAILELGSKVTSNGVLLSTAISGSGSTISGGS